MSECRIVPAIDLIEGRCVRLRRGNFDEREIVGDDPIEVARRFAGNGFTRLHLVDLEGARSGAPRHLDVVREIVAETGLAVDCSGGIRTAHDLSRVFASGARQVVIGSAAVEQPEVVREWITEFGSDAVIVGLDVLNGEVRIKGWREGSACTIAEVLERFVGSGLRWLMSTDIERDGTLEGASVGLYQMLRREYPELRLIASGGVTTAQDIQALADAGVREVIVGKALYAGTVDPEEVRAFVW